jgi:hypothetical protein
LRLVRCAGSPVRPARSLCSHPLDPIPQPRRGGIVGDGYLIPPNHLPGTGIGVKV